MLTGGLATGVNVAPGCGGVGGTGGGVAGRYDVGGGPVGGPGTGADGGAACGGAGAGPVAGRTAAVGPARPAAVGRRERGRPPGCRSSRGTRRSSRRTVGPPGCWCRSSRTPPRPSNPPRPLRAADLPTLRRRLPAASAGKRSAPPSRAPIRKNGDREGLPMTELASESVSQRLRTVHVSLRVDRAQRGSAVSACASCGQDNAPDAQFCTECGEYLGWSSGAPAAAPAPTPAWVDDAAPADPTPRRHRPRRPRTTSGPHPTSRRLPAPTPCTDSPAPTPLRRSPGATPRGPAGGATAGPGRRERRPACRSRPAAARRASAGPAEAARRPARADGAAHRPRPRRPRPRRGPAARRAPEPPRPRQPPRAGPQAARRAGAERRRRRGVQAGQEHARQRPAADRRLPHRRRHRHGRAHRRPVRPRALGRGAPRAGGATRRRRTPRPAPSRSRSTSTGSPTSSPRPPTRAGGGACARSRSASPTACSRPGWPSSTPPVSAAWSRRTGSSPSVRCAPPSA